MEALRESAAKLHANIYRAKGVIHTMDASQRRAILQVVGKRVDISLQDEWGERKPHTKIVVIGAAGGFDSNALREKFDSCQSSPHATL
jgi:G3E family GTPase